VLAASLGGVATLMAQNQSAATRSASATATTPPNIEGYWQGNGYATIDHAYDLEKGMPRDERIITGRPADGKKNDAIVVDTPDQKIPYLPWTSEYRERFAKALINPTRLEDLDSLTRCFQMGVPRQSFLGSFQVIQSPEFVIIVHSNGGARQIALDGRPHIDSRIKLWSGDSIGHWEGNTLVVDVTNLNENAWYDAAGNFHSADLHLVERWTVVGKDLIRYEVQNIDPKVFSRPWTLKNEYKRNSNPEELWENSCYEGERGIALMLSAAQKKREEQEEPGNAK
jgi:hypothetical protein